MEKLLNCNFSITSEAMSTIFGSCDHWMIACPVFVFYDQWPFCLVAMATLNFTKGFFLNDTSSKTTEAVGLLFCTNVAWVRAIQIAKIMVICLMVWL